MRQKIVFTLLFAFLSVALTWTATDSVAAAGAVLFGLWSILVFTETAS